MEHLKKTFLPDELELLLVLRGSVIFSTFLMVSDKFLFYFTFTITIIRNTIRNIVKIIQRKSTVKK